MADTMNELVQSFDKGKVLCADKEICCGELEWNPHPAFEGVALKHLVSGAETEGGFSVHLVRISQGKSIGEHTHNPQYEFIQVLEGRGRCSMGGKEYDCVPGMNLVASKGLVHSITAVDGDIYLFAKFVPALF